METAKLIVGIVHIILSVIIIALILLQSGKQAGLPGAVGGAADSFFGKNKGRTMDAMLGRFTKVCAVAFLITSLFLAYGDAVINKNADADVTTEDLSNIELPAEDELFTETETPAETESTETAPEETGAEN